MDSTIGTKRLGGCSLVLGRYSAKVETYFVHSPDPDTPIEQTVDGMQLVYASGKYKHVGHTFLVLCESVSCSEADVFHSSVSRISNRMM